MARVVEDRLASDVQFPPAFELALGLLRPGMVLLDLGANLGTLPLAAAALGCRVIAVEASAQPVSTVLAESGADHVDLVRLGVEGSEIAAIAGMTTLLNRPDAPPVVYESNAHTLRMFGASPEDLLGRFEDLGYTSYLIGERALMPAARDTFQPDTCVDYLAVKGRCDPPPGWRIREPRTQDEIAWVVAKESTSHVVDARAQVARSLERAPEWLLDRRDVRLALTALALDPDMAVTGAAEWWRAALRRSDRSSADTHRRLRDIAESGRALHDRIAHILIRWGARP